MASNRTYSWSVREAIDKQLPKRIVDAFLSTGWDAPGVYELVKTELAKEKKALKNKEAE